MKHLDATVDTNCIIIDVIFFFLFRLLTKNLSVDLTKLIFHQNRTIDLPTYFISQTKKLEKIYSSIETVKLSKQPKK